MELGGRLRGMAERMGAGFYGVADLGPAREAILEQGGAAIAEYPRAISIGIGLLHAIVDQLPQHTDRAVALTYRHHAYNLVNQRLDHIASPLAGAIQRAGYRGLPVPASQSVDSERLCAIFSHKMAAHLAGLGWIGRNCMLITPQVGPRVRWATVLTDAPLEATGGPMEQRCGTCRECVEICPVQAYTGEPYRLGEPREVRFAAHECSKYFDRMEEIKGVSVCGLCLYVCPNGRRGGFGMA
ncbi:MAG: 4Fe-4S double cluster binding domain-containing protein [Anaerolineae bacterium]